jgi:hypothetical protein
VHGQKIQGLVGHRRFRCSERNERAVFSLMLPLYLDSIY